MFTIEGKRLAVLERNTQDMVLLLSEWLGSLTSEHKAGIAHALAGGGDLFIELAIAAQPDRPSAGKYTFGVIATDGTRAPIGVLSFSSVQLQ